MHLLTADGLLDTTIQAARSAEYLLAHAVGERGSRALANLRARLRAAPKPPTRLTSSSTEHAAAVLPPPRSLGDETPANAAALGPAAAAALSGLLARRAAREPVQYLLGEWDFHELEGIAVGPPVLVPRPETEELVDLALAAAANALKESKAKADTAAAAAAAHRAEMSAGVEMNAAGAAGKPRLCILDVGAGTGAIGVALLCALKRRAEAEAAAAGRPAAEAVKAVAVADSAAAVAEVVVVALEPHPAAHALACANAARFGVADAYCCFPGSLADFVALRGRAPKRRAGEQQGAGESQGSQACGQSGEGGARGSSSSAEAGPERVLPPPPDLPLAFGRWDPFSASLYSSSGGGGAEPIGCFDLIVSNPPYIPERDMADLPPEVARFEDRGALCGGADGLDVVRQIAHAAPALLHGAPHGDARRTTTPVGDGGAGVGVGNVWLEVDTSHPAMIEAWLPSAHAAPPVAEAAAEAAAAEAIGATGAGLPGALTTNKDEEAGAFGAAEDLRRPPLGVFWASSHLDFAGRPRFCSLLA